MDVECPPRPIDECIREQMQSVVSHAYISDLGIPEMEVRNHWPLLATAIESCQAEGGFVYENLKKLLRTEVDFGRGEIIWAASFRMDGAGKLHAICIS